MRPGLGQLIQRLQHSHGGYNGITRSVVPQRAGACHGDDEPGCSPERPRLGSSRLDQIAVHSCRSGLNVSRTGSGARSLACYRQAKKENSYDQSRSSSHRRTQHGERARELRRISARVVRPGPAPGALTEAPAVRAPVPPDPGPWPRPLQLSSVDSAAAVGKAGRLIAPESVIIGFGLFWQRGDMLPGVTP